MQSDADRRRLQARGLDELKLRDSRLHVREVEEQQAVAARQTVLLGLATDIIAVELRDVADAHHDVVIFVAASTFQRLNKIGVKLIFHMLFLS